MNIGIFVTSLDPDSPAQARFQTALLEGLARVRQHPYRFFIFSHHVPVGLRNTDTLTYVRIDQYSRLTQATLFAKELIGRVLLSASRLLPVGAGRPGRWARQLMRSEPRHYRQFRELDVRLLWNMNQHDLPTFLPYIRTVWDLNHRIHPMYPEFSYTRYTFDVCDRGLADSLARASYVIVGTQEGKRQVAGMFGVHAGKIRVIPFPAPVFPSGEKGSAPTRVPAHARPYIFYPARFWPHKNHVVVVAALKTLRDKWKIRLNCVFCGGDEGNLGYVLKYARDLGVGDQIHYLGHVPDDELVRMYKDAAALVFASAVGPDNLPPLEAMSLGCPVIAADVPGARERYDAAALYFPATDDEQLAERIRELLSDDSLRARLIAHGHDRAEAWSVEDYAKSALSILDEFLSVARAWEKNDAVFT
jgi:glycosyltransferase involved in cell wall biosynthesis